MIEARCGEDPALAAEVRLLLDACDAEEELMASCRLEPRAVPEDQPARKQVGPYEIDRLLGRGGMGAVYLAHRADGHFEQKVAIKLIDRPFDTDLFRERFRQERQILAGLQHPYIARLLDGGVTAEGELYLVMEYVDGVPIHRFCQERQLSQTQRIELFLRVCEAVQFAHQNFIVHRDLKPDNILVAADGTPRLLDFGTAKLLSPSLAGQDSQLTREGYLSFTPQYASPEQVLGNPITTASDTYSLGVLLYLLLTGAPPYELKDLTMGEMLRTVCEEAPRRPLRGRLGQAARRRSGSDSAESSAQGTSRALSHRRAAGRRSSRLSRRAAGGGAPRHLPLPCRQVRSPPSVGLWRRRPCWLVTLIAGVAGVVWQASVANRERRLADIERHKAEARSADLRQLSNSLLTELDEAIQQIPGSTGAQKLLVTSVLEHLDRMAQDAHGDRQTQLDLANAYTQLGNLQGNAYSQNLGDSTAALASIDKAIALSKPFAGPNSKDREAIHALANAQLSRSEILFGAAPILQAISSTQAAIASYDKLLAMRGGTTSELCDDAQAYNILGDELGLNTDESLNDFAGALSAYRSSLALFDRAWGIDPKLTRANHGRILCQRKIAQIEIEIDPVQALKDLQIGLQGIAALPKEEQADLKILRRQNAMLTDEADALVQLGNYAEANAIIDRVLKEDRRLVAADPQDTRALADLRVSLNQSANNFETAADPALGASGNNRRRSLTAAERPWSQYVGILEKMLQQDTTRNDLKFFLANAQVHLGSIQTILHSSSDSDQLVKTGLAALKNMAAKNQNSSEILYYAAQDFLNAEPVSLRDPQLAVSYAERAVTLTDQRLPSRLLTLARAYRAAGQMEKSRAAAKEGLALLPAVQPGRVKPRIRKLLEIQAQGDI